MLTLHKIWHGGMFALAVLLIASITALQYENNRPVQASANTCSFGTVFTQPVPQGPLMGEVPVEVYIPPLGTGSSTIAEPDHVEFYVNNNYIGDAEEANSGATGTWGVEWNTEDFTNGPKQITAEVYGDNGDILCTTQPYQVDVQNANEPEFEATELRLVRVNPESKVWIGLTNFPREFKVRAIIDTPEGPENVTQQTDFDWRLDGASVGSIPGTGNENSIQYFSGPREGNARLIVTAQYLGETDQLEYDIFVRSENQSTFPELEDDEIDGLNEDLNEDEIDPLKEPGEDEPTPAERVSSDPELRDCLIDIIGEDGYEAVAEGTRRLTFKELDQADRCFAVTRYLIPSTVAPIEPERIREIREDSRRVRVETVEQAALEDNREGILLSGVAEPNITIVIYIFSEPLVLTTTTDENGNWSYVLEDPLEPGEHEVLVAVEDEDGETVRSSAFTFNVAQAASIDTNPSGLSLTLDLSDSGENSTIYYVSAVTAVMLVGLGLYIFVMRRSDVAQLDDAKNPATSTKSKKS